VARVSVVVPIYNVEEYLAECLDSLIAQSFGDWEAVMVDDGSPDGSRAIAEDYAARDGRFRLVTQENAGLGAARNTGAANAQGEFLMFLDSDDKLTRHALRTLVGSLDETGSDFVTGNVHRFNRGGTSQAPFVAKAFPRTRPKTHITKFRALLYDRIAPNKLFRRSFWDKHGFAFPVGVTHEDIPVILPAHFLAKSVDVIAEPVYLYRARETGGLSITQRRLEPKVLMDRLAAVTHVSRFLGRHPLRRRAKRWYDASVVAEDLRYYLNVLPFADEAYKQLFLDEVNGFLRTAHRRAIEPLTAIERVKWELVKRRRMDELIEVIRFQREDLRETVPIEESGRFYGDYPYFGDAAVGVPKRAYELRQELTLTAYVHGIEWRDERAHVDGAAYITGVGAPSPGSQHVKLVALRAGRFKLWRRMRRRVPWLGIRVRTEEVRRPEFTAMVRQQLADLEWAGWRASVSARALGRFRFGRSETWELYAQVRAGRVTRRTVRFRIFSSMPARGADLPRPDGSLLRVAPGPGQRLNVELRRRWGIVREFGSEGGEIELRGELYGLGGGVKLELVRRDGDRVIERKSYAVSASGGSFSVRVPAAELVAADTAEHDVEDESDEQGVRWEAFLVGGGRRTLALAEEAGVAAWPVGDLEVALHRTFAGDAVLVARKPQPVAVAAEWSEDGTLSLTLADPDQSLELGVWAPASNTLVTWPGARLQPAAIETMGDPVPLREGTWHLVARAPGASSHVPLALSGSLVARLPLSAAVDGKRFALGAMGGERGALVVSRALPDDQRGGYHQRRLRTRVYPERRGAPLRDAVVYASFEGRQVADSPRAIFDELVRRGSPLEHLWVVRDGMARAPEGATLVREGSTEHYDALATARYVVANEDFPAWFERRPEQVAVQTLTGTPLKMVGRDVEAAHPTQKRFEGAWRGTSVQWQHVLSPSTFATPVLRRAFAIEGQVHETGSPRADRLAAPGLEERSRELRARLGLPADKRVVLYAPSFRDHIVDHRGRPRIDLHLDLERLREIVGDDTVVLFRKHHLVFDPAPSAPDGFVRDASGFGDGTELLLAADVLVTDYSSAIFDWALTGRPAVLFAYDLETYRDDVRGLYLDLEADLPYPVARTTDALGETLRSLPTPDVAAFRAKYCDLDDGAAAARAVDAIFGA
jgi:CDP-glycerol glycerophosphotransferase